VGAHDTNLGRQSLIVAYRNAFLITGGRVILFLRQRQMFDLEILEQLGEREAAKLFKED
jgi:hypothetical protein